MFYGYLLFITGDFKSSIPVLANMLDIKGNVLPITEENVNLIGITKNGERIIGEETAIKASGILLHSGRFQLLIWCGRRASQQRVGQRDRCRRFGTGTAYHALAILGQHCKVKDIEEQQHCRHHDNDDKYRTGDVFGKLEYDDRCKNDKNNADHIGRR